jgi:lysophospholipase L1-like esterase
LFVAVAAAGPVLVFILAEIGVRIFAEPVRSLDLFVRSDKDRLEAEGMGDAVFEGDALLGWRLRPNLEDAYWDYTVFSTNADHLRYPERVGRKESGALRVLCMGDSVTFGYRVPVAWPEHPEQHDREARPYPALLEQRLRAARPGRTIEVIPLAVPGYTSHQGLAWLRRDIGRYRPDLVTLCYGWNDVDLRGMPDAASFPTGGWRVAARRCAAASRLIGHMSLWMADRRAAGAAKDDDAGGGAAGGAPKPVPRSSREAFAANTMAMATLARERGAKVIVIGTVYRDATTNRSEAARMTAWRAGLAEAARAADVPYLEIPELIESGAPANDRLFGEVIHPNSLGHRLMAERLEGFIVENRLLDGNAR